MKCLAVRFATLPIFPAIILLSAVILLPGCSQKKSKDTSTPPEVSVTPVKRQDVPIIKEWVGALDGSVNARIQARVNGYVITQKYKEGSWVKKGEILFEIDPRPFQVSLAQAKADMAMAQANEINLRGIAERDQKLFKEAVISKQELDSAVASAAAAKAQLEAQKAAVAQAELNLQYTKVIAPVDGIAGIANVNVGDLVGSTTLTTISVVDPIKAYISLSEQEYLASAAQFERLETVSQQAQPSVIEMVLADGKTYPYKGKFDFADRQVDVGTGTIRIAELFPNPQKILRPGQFARIRVPVAIRKGALLVPQRAVNELQGSYQLTMIDSNNVAHVRPVKMGDRVGTMWVVDQGIKPNEKVVVEGIQNARDGMKVLTKPWIPPVESPSPASEDDTTATAPIQDGTK